ncbi:MAG: YbhB/YbcL family Raf kinase inhibitor-like protein, partial [Cutibacterium sp.]|nr:YbhB/YbcL family Raf kinase inhibitor-like protein [Cutibacterium sp.]
MKITSTSITEGQPIELAYAHADAGGKNISPQLSWTPGPEGTKSYAITI